MSDDGDSGLGFICGIFIGMVAFVLFWGVLIDIPNIEEEAGCSTIDVVKIYKFSDGSQAVQTSGYGEIFGFRISHNITYSDPNHLIKNLGKYKAKCSCRVIQSLLTNIEEDNKNDLS